MVDVEEEIETIRLASATVLKEIDAQLPDTSLLPQSVGPAWPTQQPIDAGLKRVICQAYEIGDPDIIAIVLQRTVEQLSRSVKEGNEIFVLATLSATLSAQELAIGAGTSWPRRNLRSQIELGFEQSLKAVLSSGETEVSDSRIARMAHRVIATLVEYAGLALLRDDQRTYLVIIDVIASESTSAIEEAQEVGGEYHRANASKDGVHDALRTGLFLLIGLGVHEGRGELFADPSDADYGVEPKTSLTNEAVMKHDFDNRWHQNSWVGGASMAWVDKIDPEGPPEALLGLMGDFVIIGNLWWYLTKALRDEEAGVQLSEGLAQDFAGVWERHRDKILSAAEVTSMFVASEIQEFCDQEFSTIEHVGDTPTSDSS